MLDKLREIFVGLGADSFEQSQNEAILTMLVWVMRSDGKLNPEESDKLGEFAQSIRWQSDQTIKEFVLAQIERIKQLDNGTLTETELLDECAAKLDGPDIRYKAIKVCHELAKADNYFDRAEVHLLKRFSSVLL